MRKTDLCGTWHMTGNGFSCNRKIPGSVYSFLLENKLMEDPYYRINELEALKLSELRADDDRLVDEGTCNRYAQVYTAPEVDTIAGGGHNFATLAARAAVEEKTAAFIKANL